jgi:riboflavin-specific deaminase-like protein
VTSRGLDRPEVRLNCAASMDGKIAFAGGAPAPLSDPTDLVRVHRLRADSDAILVGVGTVERDDPSLRVRWDILGRPPGTLPLRVCLDPRGRIPDSARFLDGSAPTLIVTTEGSRRRFPPSVETLVVGPGPEVDLPRCLAGLRNRGVRRLMVEGGSRVLTSFLRSGLYDVFTMYLAPVFIGGTTAPSVVGGSESRSKDDWVRAERVGVEPLGEGVLVTLRPRPG